MMPVTYNYTAVNCPALPVASVMLDVFNSAVDPLIARKAVASTQGPGSTTGWANPNAKMLDELGKWGGGAIALVFGLDLVAGTTGKVGVTAGAMAGLGANAQKFTNFEVVAADGWKHIWMDASGTGYARTDLLFPAALSGYLGRVEMIAGVATNFDYSGRGDLVNNILMRRTNDAGVPGDTPNARLRFFTKTLGGLYYWDGAQYWRVSVTPAAADANDAITVSSPPLQAEVEAIRDELHDLKDKLRTAGYIAP